MAAHRLNKVTACICSHQSSNFEDPGASSWIQQQPITPNNPDTTETNDRTSRPKNRISGPVNSSLASQRSGSPLFASFIDTRALQQQEQQQRDGRGDEGVGVAHRTRKRATSLQFVEPEISPRRMSGGETGIYPHSYPGSTLTTRNRMVNGFGDARRADSENDTVERGRERQKSETRRRPRTRRVARLALTGQIYYVDEEKYYSSPSPLSSSTQRYHRSPHPNASARFDHASSSRHSRSDLSESLYTTPSEKLYARWATWVLIMRFNMFRAQDRIREGRRRMSEVFERLKVGLVDEESY